jgi:phospholipid/cholesterol/gamma-HCH transport system substrate-binding protein
MNNSQQTARVGLFFLLGVALVWVTFETLSGGKVFQEKGYQIIAGFDSLKELKQGDEVRMAGVKIGEVASTRLAGRRAEAILEIDRTVKIKSDAKATIAMSGLIGTNYISIDLGSATAPDLQAGAEISTKTTADFNTIMSDLGNLGQKLDGALTSLSQSLGGSADKPGLVQNLDRLVTDNRENITSTIANLKDVTEKIKQGDGTLGKLINSPQLHDDLVATITEIRGAATEAKTFVANAQGIVDQVKSGKGTIGALVYDEKAGEDLKVSLANIRTVSDKMAKGEGTLGKLMTDDSLLKDAQAIMKKADRALDGMSDSGPITAVGIVAQGLF